MHTRIPCLALVALLFSAAPAAADMALRNWENLGQAADQIVLGTVTGVQGGPAGNARGEIIGRIAVEETFRGAALSQVRVLGSRTDASQPNFRKGIRVIVFLAERDPAGKRGPGQRRGVRRAIGGASGVLVVPERMVASTADFVRTLVASEDTLGWKVLEPSFFEAAPPVHPVLIGVSLEELRGRVSRDDEPDLMRAACNATGVWRSSVHLWAMGMAGRLQLASTTQCLEAKATDSADFGERVAAAGALGDLGDPKSADTLIPLLLPPEDADTGNDDLAEIAALSLGKLGTPVAVGPLVDLALDGTDDLGLHGTAVHSLGLIGEGGDKTARRALRQIAKEHPNKLVRKQARQTLRRIRGER